ncbi:MAG: ABC transporter substrate-binding protein [Candidatus Thermoplasmatota archaeon]|nr:ABC transporter substrate-binding protein [Candidatus Thermoplasmatota archaeon]
MKDKGLVRILLAVVITILFSSMTPGCLDDGPVGSREFVDDMGVIVRTDGVPSSIVTLTPALTEIVFLLGLENVLVGCDSDSNYPSEADKIEKVSSWSGLNSERIVELGPDLIFMDNTLDASGSRYAELTGLGLNVYRTHPRTLEDILENIEAISEIMGVKSKGEEVANSMRQRILSVEGQASTDPAGDPPSVLHVVYYDGTDDPWVMADSTFSGDLIDKAGGKAPIRSGQGLSVQVSLERIIDGDPDIIICSQSSLWPTRTRELLMNDTRLSGVAAVSGSRIYEIDADIIDRTGPRLIDGLERIRALIEDFHKGD